MKIAPYVEKLNHSQQYAAFVQQHSDAFMVAGFFVLDFEAGQNIHQIDYYVPKERKIAAFTLDHGVTMQLLSTVNMKIPEALDFSTKTDLDALKGILEDEMKNRNITEEVRKIIAVIQTVKGRKIWNVNCVLSGMGILRASIEDESQTVLKMEKASLLDYIKRIPGAQLAAMQQQAKQQGMLATGDSGAAQNAESPEAAAGAEEQEASPDEVKAELAKLDRIEAALAREKAELQKQLEKEAKNKAAAQSGGDKAKKTAKVAKGKKKEQAAQA